MCAKGQDADRQLKLTSSQEDYLEAIYRICREKQAARAGDIAAAMHVNNSSVTGALRALAARELINYAPYDLITLTPRGEEVAADVARRHRTVRRFLVDILGLPTDVAEPTACQMEHAVSRAVLERLASFLDYIDRSPLRDLSFDRERGFHCAATGPLGPPPGTLADLPVGEHAELAAIPECCGVCRRLRELGATPGTVVHVLRRSDSGLVEAVIDGVVVAIPPVDAARLPVR